MRRVLLAPTLELANKIKTDATVEAEYGDTVIEGNLVTLAHHSGEWADNPAPCNNYDVPRLPSGSTILVSHIDLDTLGGIAALWDLSFAAGKKEDGVMKPFAYFWEAAEFIDLHGPHYLSQIRFTSNLAKYFNAYWAWSYAQGRAPRYTKITDVTDLVKLHLEAVCRILNDDEELLAAGEKWAKETTEKVEACLLEENPNYRLFATSDVFCSAGYYSPKFNQVIPVTISINTKIGTITIACTDGSINCRDIVQSIWGLEAGGHAGIAGSPRGQKMKLADLNKAVQAVKRETDK
jgi:hypothetical protein